MWTFHQKQIFSIIDNNYDYYNNNLLNSTRISLYEVKEQNKEEWRVKRNMNAFDDFPGV